MSFFIIKNYHNINCIMHPLLCMTTVAHKIYLVVQSYSIKNILIIAIVTFSNLFYILLSHFYIMVNNLLFIMLIL